MDQNQALDALFQLLNKANKAGAFDLNESTYATTALNTIAEALRQKPEIVPVKQDKEVPEPAEEVVTKTD